jgi:hypothetical protein
MRWKIEQHKRGNGTAEIQVAILVKEMDYSYASNSEEWIRNFQDRLKSEVPRTNAYSAEFTYKAIPIDVTTLEVWKMKVNCDFNYKMFTVTKI